MVTALVRHSLREGGAGRERHRRGRHREVGAMVLADTENIQADLIGQGHLLQEILKALPGP